MDKKIEQDLMRFCRLYKGQKQNPYTTNQNKAAIWHYEQAWLFDFANSNTSHLMSHLHEYISVGLATFSLHDGVPVTLKATLFNRYARTCYSMIDAAESFKEFYKEYLNM